MDHAISELCYESGNFTKEFSYNSFVKFLYGLL